MLPHLLIVSGFQGLFFFFGKIVPARERKIAAGGLGNCRKILAVRVSDAPRRSAPASNLFRTDERSSTAATSSVLPSFSAHLRAASPPTTASQCTPRGPCLVPPTLPRRFALPSTRVCAWPSLPADLGHGFVLEEVEVYGDAVLTPSAVARAEMIAYQSPEPPFLASSLTAPANL